MSGSPAGPGPGPAGAVFAVHSSARRHQARLGPLAWLLRLQTRIPQIFRQNNIGAEHCTGDMSSCHGFVTNCPELSVDISTIYSLLRGAGSSAGIPRDPRLATPGVCRVSELVAGPGT